MTDNWVALVKSESLVTALTDDDERLKDYLLRADKRVAPTQVGHSLC